MKNVAFIIISVMLLTIFPQPLLAVKTAPRITDREIVERLTRLEEGQKELNARIDDLDKKLNSRIDDLDKKLSTRISDLDKKLSIRIGDLDKKLNIRIDDFRSEMRSSFASIQWMLGLFITITLVILGFVLRMQWQMHKKITALEVTQEAHEKELDFLKNLIEKLIPPRGIL